MAKQYFYLKKLTDKELLKIIEDDNFDVNDYFSSYNDPDTDIEDFDEGEGM